MKDLVTGKNISSCAEISRTNTRRVEILLTTFRTDCADLLDLKKMGTVCLKRLFRRVLAQKSQHITASPSNYVTFLVVDE